MAVLRDYAERLYVGLLGKVVGVYMGRPIEGWTRRRIAARWDEIPGYVHADLGKPLVVPDDDISGTLTFIRALEDSGLYADTTAEWFGRTWLNYLIENKTILWWGGMGVSTEHTAWLRLTAGVPAPLSGAIATNGKTVAEQIGAQIFIDACGLVAPGRPELAAQLARRAASVSHDGEAVNAAVVQAAMVAGAFVEHRMGRLLDHAMSLIPARGLIARLHRDVRGWAARGGDWRRTFDRIAARYGYDKFGGGCHVVPNHAVMVMAWCHAPGDFYRSQRIVNSAGWDTDCNAGNVGCVMGVKCGLAGINRRYDFQGPSADRVVLPAAEGSRGATDVLIEARRLERLGRVVMGWSPARPTKGGAWHHYSMPGALHGWQGEDASPESQGAAAVANVSAPRGLSGRALRIAYDVSSGRVARVSTPVLPVPPETTGAYRVEAVPRLYPGMTVTAEALAGRLGGAARAGGDVRARLFVRAGVRDGHIGQSLYHGPARRLRPGRRLRLSLKLPPELPWPAWDLGIQIDADSPAGGACLAGDLFIDRVSLGGRPAMAWPDPLPALAGTIPGWVSSADRVCVDGSAGAPATRVVQNRGRGILVTGDDRWTDYVFAARLSIRLADAAGLVVRYQGLERYVALVKVGRRLRLLRRWYGHDDVLAEAPCPFADEGFHRWGLGVRGRRIAARCDGRLVLQGVDDRLAGGGAGLLCQAGRISFQSVSVR